MNLQAGLLKSCDVRTKTLCPVPHRSDRILSPVIGDIAYGIWVRAYRQVGGKVAREIIGGGRSGLYINIRLLI
ncbi:MAG: hypothetical protein WC373_02305 [Smithella sp.]